MAVKKVKYRYFVAYNLMTDKGIVVGNTICNLDTMITDVSHVRDIEAELNRLYNATCPCVSVVTFQFLTEVIIK